MDPYEHLPNHVKILYLCGVPTPDCFDMTNSRTSSQFYCLSTIGGQTTFAVSPDLFERAIKNGLHGPESGREIHRQLLYGNDEGGYPSYIGFPVVYRQFEGKRMCDMLDMRFDGHCFLISDRMKQLLEDNQSLGGVGPCTF